MKKLLLLLTFTISTIVCMGSSTKKRIAPNHQFVKPAFNNVDTANREAGQIPVIAWIGVPQAQSVLSRYQELASSGITQSYYPFSNANAMEAALNLAQKAGVKLFVGCPELTSDPEATAKRFMNHPALAGYFLKDEPKSQDFPGLGQLVKRIRAIDDKHICYVNLFPNYASAKQLGVNTYQEYLDAFIKEVPTQLLSFDFYPINGNTGRSIQSQWYSNLEQVSAEARKSNRLFWAFALSVAFTPHPIPIIEGLRLQVYSNLAYGAQGIQYFTYWTVNAPGVSFSDAPITRDGKETDVYGKIQAMNEEIKNLSVVFAGAKMISVAQTGDVIPAGTKPLTKLPKPILSLKTDGLGAIVSVLTKGNDFFLVVVNRDFTAPMDLNIKCVNGVSMVLKNGTSMLVNHGTNAIKIGPGDIAIYTWPTRLN